MKKLLSLLLVGMMSISLCACSGTENSSVEKESGEVVEESKTVYEVGDTVSTDWAEFKLQEIEVGDKVVIKFSIKNIGKENLGQMVDGSREICSFINVNYNDYILNFESSACSSLGEDGRSYAYLDIPVLSDAVDYRAAMTLPEQVVEDTEAELFLDVKLRTSDDEVKTFQFKIK